MSRRRTEVTEGEVAIPVTPMLDMTFQLLIFFIVTFNPNRIVEGFWPAEISQESGDGKGGGGGDGGFPPPNKENTWILKVRFDENHARAGFPLNLLAGPTDSPENHPRPIAAEEIAAIKDASERTQAGALAAKDKASFVLTLNSISADGRIGGNERTVSYDDLCKELAAVVEKRQKEVVAAHAGTANKEEREMEIAGDMARFKIVIYGERSLRWWRFNQIRDVCNAAGFRNIQPGMPDVNVIGN